MAKKGHYDVGPSSSGGALSSAPVPGESSYRACTMTLLVFLLFCVVINIAVWLIIANRGGEKSRDAATLALHGDGDEVIPHEVPAITEEVPTTLSYPTPSRRGGVEVVEGVKSTHNGTTEELHDASSSGASADIVDASVTEILPVVTTPKPPPEPVICNSVECKELGSTSLASMGHGANPCNNFFDYACGGMRRNKYQLSPDYEAEAWTRINDQVNGVGDSSPESFKKFKALIKSCDHYDTEKHIDSWRNEVLVEMKSIGEFSFMTVHEPDEYPNLTSLFLSLLQHDRPVVAEVRLDVDEAKAERFALQVLPWRLGAASAAAGTAGAEEATEAEAKLECQLEAAATNNYLNDIYDKTLECMRNGNGRKTVMDAVSETLNLLGVFKTEENLNKTLHTYNEFLQLDNEALGDKIKLRRDLQLLKAKEKTTEEMSELFQQLEVDWNVLVKALIGRSLNDDERIHLYGENYFKNIGEKYHKDAHWRLNDALLTAWAASRGGELLAAQRRWKWLPPSSLHCARVAARLMPDAASALYVRSFSKEEIANLSQSIENLFLEVQDALHDELHSAVWLDSYADFKYALSTKRLDLQKIKDIKDFDDTVALDSALHSYEMNETNFVGNAIKLMTRNRKSMYGRFNGIPKNNTWTYFLAPYETDGKSIYALNVIAIPLGATEKPFFSPKYPHYIQMAGLGAMVAQEVAHHFDLVGITIDTNITNVMEEKFKDRIHTNGRVGFRRDINVEYLNETEERRHHKLSYRFEDTAFELKKNDFLTDSVGVRLAYRAFNWAFNRSMSRGKRPAEVLPFLPLTAHQSFFLHLAQKYCTKYSFFSMVEDFFEDTRFPPEVRVDLMVGFKKFYSNFNCPAPDDNDFPYGELSEYPEV